jgi:hypothetical protein
MDWTEKGHLENPQLAQHSYRQEPVAVLAFLRSPHTNAGMKQYKCGQTNYCIWVTIMGKLAVET